MEPEAAKVFIGLDIAQNEGANVLAVQSGVSFGMHLRSPLVREFNDGQSASGVGGEAVNHGVRDEQVRRTGEGGRADRLAPVNRIGAGTERDDHRIGSHARAEDLLAHDEFTGRNGADGQRSGGDATGGAEGGTLAAVMMPEAAVWLTLTL
jgi:hypothetical protein